MKKKLLLLFSIALINTNAFSQISYEKGYIVNQSGETINCLIKNMDWKNNPESLEYKTNETSEIITTPINNIKEFGIFNISKYVRTTVNIDRSTDNIMYLTDTKNPIFKEEQLLLKVLIEGKASLYLYEDGNLKRYFYNVDNNEIKQLVYKSYLNENDDIAYNNQFKQQLWNNVKCSNLTMKEIEYLEYKKRTLSKYFIVYNDCNNTDIIDYDKKGQKDLINLTIRPRINSSQLKLDNSSSERQAYNFDNKIGLGIGLELEFILPFNKNKWSLALEPTYQSFNSETSINVTNLVGGKSISKIDYSSIELPLSLRHYFFLNDNSKIFANISYILDFSSTSEIQFTRADNSITDTLDFETKNSFAFGVGFKQNDTYSLELRYLTSRDILGNYAFWGSNYTSVSLIFGYTLF